MFFNIIFLFSNIIHIECYINFQVIGIYFVVSFVSRELNLGFDCLTCCFGFAGQRSFGIAICIITAVNGSGVTRCGRFGLGRWFLGSRGHIAVPGPDYH